MVDRKAAADTVAAQVVQAAWAVAVVAEPDKVAA